jgi:hypothetical protein
MKPQRRSTSSVMPPESRRVSGGKMRLNSSAVWTNDAERRGFQRSQQAMIDGAAMTAPKIPGRS